MTSLAHPQAATPKAFTVFDAIDLLDRKPRGFLLAVADETSGSETYGGGRYVLDTVKGADLGNDGSRLIVDFNFAYNPSCAFDSRWACPLAPPANRLPVRLEVGERAPGL